MKATATIRIYRQVDGVGVSSTVIQYALSSSKDVAPTSEWSETQPEWESGSYLWTRIITFYTDGSWSISTPVVDTSWVYLATLIDSTKNAIAQQLGYTDYDSMVSSAKALNTIIDGGYINTALIEVVTLLAGQIFSNALNIGNGNFTVDIDGNMVSGSAKIEGSITATSFIESLTYPDSTSVDPSETSYVEGDSGVTYTIESPSISGTHIEMYSFILTRVPPANFRFNAPFYMVGSDESYNSTAYQLNGTIGCPCLAKAIWVDGVWVIKEMAGFVITSI